MYRDGVLEGTVRRPDVGLLHDVWNEEQSLENPIGGNANGPLRRTSDRTGTVE